MWKHAFISEDENSLSKEYIINFINNIKKNTDYNCKYIKDWFIIWDDIKVIVQNINFVGETKIQFSKIFKSWYHIKNLKCSLHNLFQAQYLRLELLKIII